MLKKDRKPTRRPEVLAFRVVTFLVPDFLFEIHYDPAQEQEAESGDAQTK